jgi:hypothetical protein
MFAGPECPHCDASEPHVLEPGDLQRQHQPDVPEPDLGDKPLEPEPPNGAAARPVSNELERLGKG